MGFRDDVLEGIPLGIKAVVRFEVVFDHRDSGRRIDVREREAVRPTIDGGVTMAGLVDGAGLAREAHATGWRLHSLSRVDRASDGRERGRGGTGACTAESAEILCVGKYGVFVRRLWLREECRDRQSTDL